MAGVRNHKRQLSSGKISENPVRLNGDFGEVPLAAWGRTGTSRDDPNTADMASVGRDAAMRRRSPALAIGPLHYCFAQ